MKRLISFLLVAAVLTMSLPLMAVAASANYEIVLETPVGYKSGEEVKVVATVKNITLAGGISGVHFLLHYDNTKLDIKTNKLHVPALRENAELTYWDDLSRVDSVFATDGFVPANNGVISLEAYDTGGTYSDSYINAGADSVIVFELVFTAKSDAASDISFWIEASETECMVLNDGASGYTLYSGIASGSKIEKTVVYNDGSCKNHIPSTPEFCTDDIVCTTCGELITAGGEHEYTDNTVGPTCTERGYDEHSCNNCSYSYKDNYVDPQHTEGEWTAVGDDKEELRCEICGELLDEREIGTTITYVFGDVNNDGNVDADDYILLKRVYFGMAKLDKLENPETALARSDVHGNDGKITGDDYILLKRVYFGTAKLK